MFKKMTKSALAFFTCVMTIMQSIVPTYALENVETTPVLNNTSTMTVSVQGNGTVVVTSNGVVTNVNAENPFTQSYAEGTNVTIEAISNDGNVINTFTNNGTLISTFLEGQTNLKVDYVTTQENANFVVAFKEIEREQEEEVTPPTGDLDKNISPLNDSGGAGGGDGSGGDISKGKINWIIHDHNDDGLGLAGTEGSPNIEAVKSAIRSMGLVITEETAPGTNFQTNAKITSSLSQAISQCRNNYIKMYGSDAGFTPRIVAVGVANAKSPATGRWFYNGTVKWDEEVDWATKWNSASDNRNKALYHNNMQYKVDTKFHNSDTSLTDFALVQLANKNNIRIIVLDEKQPMPATGDLTIEKDSANHEITDNNDCYSIEGAEYGLYENEADANKDVNRVGTFTINKDGKANTIKDLKVETYYLKETKAPKGYALDPKVYAVQVKSGELTTRKFVDIPQSDPIAILLGKVDKETNANKPQGSASLENAEFTVKFYGGLYDEDPATKGVSPIRRWVLKTDEKGRIRLDDNYKISGDEFWTNSFGVATLPIGTLTIQETKAPTGYKLNEEVFVRKITIDGNSESVQTYNQPTIPEPIMLGDFSIRKIITSGNASEIVRPEVGAEFTAIYKGYVEKYGSFEEALKHMDEFQVNEHSTLVTNEQGNATSGKLAYGTYVVKQTKATEETDILKESFEVTVSKDGQHFEYTINNRPSTYYVKIVKKDADSGKTVSLNNASFQIVKYKKDGSIDANYNDKGQIKTDANGIVSVKNGAVWYNTFVTNADNRLSFVEQLGKYEGMASEDKGSVTVPLQLPSGDYGLQETDVPDGYLKGQSVKFSLKKDLVTETDPDGDAVLTVEYRNPKPKGRIELTKEFEDPDYIMHGKVTFDLIVVKDIVDPADGTVLYKANDVYGTYELNKDNNKIVIENLPMGVGESHFKLVEKTTYENYVLNTQEYSVDFVQTDMGIPTYTHEVTIENKLIKVRTQALNANTKDNQFNSAKQITVTDVVSYEGLLAGQEYTMHGVLMDKETGEPVKNADGSIVEGYKKFTPEEANGTVNVEMTLDASQLGGKDFVVFESVLNTGVEGHETCEIARHHDLTDKNQTITILDSKIGTTAKSENGSHEQQIKDGKVTFIDTVAYENLVAGMKYKVSGVLMDKTTGEALLVDGKEVTSEATFTPETSNGTVDVTFEFDASAITSNTSLVVFERLVEVHTDKEGVVEEIDVAQHEDIDDEGQTIHFIDIKTTAQSDNGTNEQQPADKEITFTDTVHYEGLQIGKEYTVKGVLMNKETNKPLLDSEGKEITGETTFTPEKANGTVDVLFILNAKDLVAGQDIVVFEDLIRDEIQIATHADINDKDQTIHIIDVKTKASSEKDNNVGLAGKKVTIKDTVSYTNLEVGKEYTVKGVLMNKETNKPLLDSEGKEITGETTFTPETSNGTVDVIFTLDSSLLAGKEVVVFEDLYKEDIKVGSHADINDKDQTIKFKNYEIKVNKVDSITKKNIVSNKFEFTMFQDEDCKEEVITVAGNTEDGTAVFEVKEGTWYIKETKAPQGYKLSKEVVKVEVKDDKLYVNDKEVDTDENYLYSIIYQNVMLPSLQTGTSTNGGMYFMMMCFSVLAFAVFYMLRKYYLH